MPRATAKRPGEIVVASADRSVPPKYAGTIEPNYYCRGWNSKRDKYCRSRAGLGTTHPGVGRCKMHGGLQENDARVRTGRYRSIETPRIRELIEQLEQDPDPFNILEDLQLARALLRDYIERASQGTTSRVPQAKLILEVLNEFEIDLREHAEPTERQLERLTEARDAVREIAAARALPDMAEAVRMLDVVSKMIYRVETLRTAGAVSLDQVRRFLAGVDRELQLHVDDEELRMKLRRSFYAIRV